MSVGAINNPKALSVYTSYAASSQKLSTSITRLAKRRRRRCGSRYQWAHAQPGSQDLDWPGTMSNSCTGGALTGNRQIHNQRNPTTLRIPRSG